MIALWFGLALAVPPVRTADTVPRGATMLQVDGGLGLVRFGVPSLPVVPQLTGDLELARGVAGGLDLRGRYTTHLGLMHRLSAEARVRLARGERWSVAARVAPSVSLAGAAVVGLDIGGDASTLAGVLATWRTPHGAWTLDAGGTVQWLLFERIGGEATVDGTPFFAFVDLGGSYEWPAGERANLSLALELRVPQAPDDPFAVLGTYPRAVFGGSFAPRRR